MVRVRHLLLKTCLNILDVWLAVGYSSSATSPRYFVAKWAQRPAVFEGLECRSGICLAALHTDTNRQALRRFFARVDQADRR